MPYESRRQERFIRAKAGQGVPWAQKFVADSEGETRMSSSQPKFGRAGSGHGRRQKVEDVEVGKARFFDPEHRRQRRLGMAELGLGVAGAAGLTLGGRGILRSTRAARDIAGVVGRKGKEKELAEVEELLRRKGVVARPRDIAAAGGGLAGLGGAVGVHNYAESRKGRAWS